MANRNGFSAKEIQGRYLVDQWRTGDERYKLLLDGHGPRHPEGDHRRT